jgi:hypothetical protein
MVRKLNIGNTGRFCRFYEILLLTIKDLGKPAALVFIIFRIQFSKPARQRKGKTIFKKGLRPAFLR